MNWINIETKTLRSSEFIGAEPVERATWLCLLNYCCEQENGGVIEDCADWSDRKWQQICGITKAEAELEGELYAMLEGELKVSFYPASKEAEVQAKRKGGAKGGKASGRARGKTEKPNKQAPSEAELEGVLEAELERKGKEGKGKEGKGIENPPTPLSENYPVTLSGDVAYVLATSQLYIKHVMPMPIENALKECRLNDEKRREMVCKFIDQFHCIGPEEKSFPINLLRKYLNGGDPFLNSPTRTESKRFVDGGDAGFDFTKVGAST